MTTKTTNPTCTEAARAYLDAKNASAKKKLVAYIEAKAQASKRVRWARLLTAIQNKDDARLRYYAATGDQRKDAAAALKKAAKPKAAPKRQSAKTRAKAAANAQVDPLGAEARKAIAAAKAAGMSPEAAAAFCAAFLEA
jgi:hypothetical protein